MMCRYKQTYDYSCGAVALMCAAYEMGIHRLPSYGKWAAIKGPLECKGNTADVTASLVKSWNGTDYQFAFLSRDVETAIYALTSGDLQSYSMPSRIVGVTKLLGLTPEIYLGDGY
jgi:hypothetical protein